LPLKPVYQTFKTNRAGRFLDLKKSYLTLYASHTVWKNRATFEARTKSEAFRAAHGRAGDHPQFEGFEVRQTVGRGKPEVV
jgi:heme-degrading monooxygenase HmoA